jgi:hypothetical protein
VAAVEIVAAYDLDGSREELEGLLLEGLESKELPEKEFWDSADHETDGMLAAYKSGPPAGRSLIAKPHAMT